MYPMQTVELTGTLNARNLGLVSSFGFGILGILGLVLILIAPRI